MESLRRRNLLQSDVIKDIKSIMKKFPTDSIEMGYGQSYDSYVDITVLRPVLVFSNNPYTIDAPALMDRELAGELIPEETVNYIAEGKIDIFLIPKGEAPFSMVSFYGERNLFSERFRRNFINNYVLVDQTNYFDVWHYKKNPSHKLR